MLKAYFTLKLWQFIFKLFTFHWILKKHRRLCGWFLWVRFKFMPCLVRLCPLRGASTQYWPQGHPLTNIQWIAVKMNRLWVWVSLLTTIATETVKWNSQVTVSQDSGARKRESEIGREEYINRLPVTSLFFQGVRFHSQVYGYLWGLSCLVWHAPGLWQYISLNTMNR